ncbi:MAG TPA: barstar family protein, partial [Longimicrobium sp.]|nr:barstar family protein [Longimicrobium sp.]
MDLRTLLDRPDPVVFMDTAEAHRQVYALQCDPGGLAVRVIRGSRCGTASMLHDEIAAALQFPNYYGENWDALDECITDLEWMPAEGYLLHLTDVERVLPDDARGFGILLRILRDAAA